MKDFRFFRTLLMFFVFLACLINAEDNVLYILHTNNTNGALENCYCPDHPYGAIEKRAVFIKQFIKEHPNTVIVDAGDFFSVTNRPLLDSLITEAYIALPYDAILTGDQELSREDLKKYITRFSFPVLAANLQDNDKLGLDNYTIIKRGGFQIGIVGIIHPIVFRFYPDTIKNQIHLSNPNDVIQSFVNTYHDSLDVIIALTHQGLEKDVSLAETVEGLDLIVGSHTQTKLDSGEVVNNCLVVQAGKEGYYVGIIELHFNEKKVLTLSTAKLETMTLDMPDEPYIMNLISMYEKKTGHVNRNKIKHQKGK